MLKNEKKEQIARKGLFVLFAVILLVVPFLHIGVRNLPYVYNDEFGYWASAARFVGMDWNEVFSKIAYYSYGYSFVLAILIFVTGSAAVAYKLAILLNGVWLILSFLCLYKSAKILFPKYRKELLMLVSFVAALFSSNIAEVNYTWPETFLFFLFCAIFYLILSIWQQSSCLKLLALSLLTVYTFFVHQRTLGIVLAIGIIVLMMLFMKKISWKQFLCFAMPILIGFILGSQVKDFVINEVWNNSGAVSGNNFSGQTHKIKSLLTYSGIKKFVLALLGKGYYVFASNYFIVPLSVCILVQWIWIAIRKKQQTIKCVIGVFLLLSLIFSLGINSIFMMTPGNVTHIVYGRYIDNVIGPFLMIGIISLFEYKINWFKNLFAIAVFSFLSYAVYYNLKVYNLYFQAAINNAGIAYMVDPGNIELAKGFIVVIAVWSILQIIKKVIVKKEIAITIASLFLLCVFFVIGQKTYSKFEMDWSKASESSMKHAQMIEDLQEEYGDLEIYAILNTQGDFPGIYAGNGIQFLLQEEQVHYVHVDEIFDYEFPENAVILSHISLGELDGFKIVSQDEVYELLVEKSLFLP